MRRVSLMMSEVVRIRSGCLHSHMTRCHALDELTSHSMDKLARKHLVCFEFIGVAATSCSMNPISSLLPLQMINVIINTHNRHIHYKEGKIHVKRVICV